MTSIPPQDQPATGYQQPGAYQAPGVGQPGAMAPQPAYAGPVAISSDARQWAMFSHLGGIIFGFLAPLIIMMTKGNEDPFVKDQATEALNFQITLAIAWVISFVLIFVVIGLLLLPVVWIVSIVLSIMAGMAANRGEAYRYPFALRLVK